MAEKETWQQEAEALARRIAHAPSSEDHAAVKDRMEDKNRLAYLLNQWVVKECVRNRGDFDDYNWFFCDAFQEVLDHFAEGAPEEFVPSFQKRFNLKRKGGIARKLEEENPQEAKASKTAIRSALREAAAEAGMESKDITAELKKINNMKNREKVHAFLERLGYDESEIEAFDKRIFDMRRTVSMDEPVKEEDGSSAQNSAVAATAVWAEQDADDRVFVILDPLLTISHRKAQMDGKNAPQEMRGFWTIGFIRLEMKDADAEEREKYIYLVFFRDNKDMYDKKGQLHARMAAKLEMSDRSWRGHYKQIQSDVFRIYHTLFHVRA